MKTILKLLFTIAIGTVSTMFAGYIFAKLWNWFVVTAFTSLPRLDFLHGVGVLSVMAFMVTPWFMAILFELAELKPGAKEISTITRQLIATLFIYPIALLGGYIWHFFIY